MTVWLVHKNSDTTEGRGPMVLDCIFLYKEDAAKYIDHQPGLMGRKGKWSEEEYGDWTMKETEVYDSFVDMKNITERKAKVAALAKLTPKEKELLGLA